MALPERARALFDLGLRSGRLPVDAALFVTRRTDTHLEMSVDRVEAAMRSAAGAIFDDDELRDQGERAMRMASDRERSEESRERDPAPRLGRD